MEELENENQRVCADCGAIIEEGNICYNCHDDVICENCYDNSYFTCEHCGEVEADDELVVIDGGDHYICEACAQNNFAQCVHCDEWHDPDNGGITTANGDYVCESCADDYYYCDECSQYYHGDDMTYCDDSDCYLCPDCYENYEEAQNGGRIYSYHEFKDWKLFKNHNETPPFYIGFELEIQPKDGDTDNQLEALNTVYDNLNAICSHDGSLGCGGFEIVSHPQTFQYIWEHRQQMENTFNTLIDLNYTSHDNNNCGLHFHVTRPEDPEVIDRLWLVLETYKKEILTLSRRTSSQIKRWAQFLSDIIVDDKKKLKALYFIKKTDKNHSRYMALNNENKKTIEFRFFKGTLKFNTFMGALEFINNLMTLCSNLKIPVEEITWNKLTDGQYIRDYVTERGIIANFAPVDTSIMLLQKENAQRAVINKIMKALTQTAREIIQAEHISKTNLKHFDEFRDKARELAKYYNDVYNNFFDFLYFLESDAQNFRVPDFIDRLEYHLRNYNYIKNEQKETIKEYIKQLKYIEREEI